MSHAENKVQKPDGASPALCSGGVVVLRRGATDSREPCPRCNDTGKHLMCANGLWITVRCTRCQGTAGGQALAASAQDVGTGALLAAFDGNASELVFWSFRYFLGRMTIATCDFAERLAIGWPHLTPNVQALIRREIDQAFARDDELRAEANETGKPPQWLPLGWDCDRAAWQKVRDAYSANPKDEPRPI